MPWRSSVKQMNKEVFLQAGGLNFLIQLLQHVQASDWSTSIRNVKLLEILLLGTLHPLAANFKFRRLLVQKGVVELCLKGLLRQTGKTSSRGRRSNSIYAWRGYDNSLQSLWSTWDSCESWVQQRSSRTVDLHSPLTAPVQSHCSLHNLVEKHRCQQCLQQCRKLSGGVPQWNGPDRPQGWARPEHANGRSERRVGHCWHTNHLLTLTIFKHLQILCSTGFHSVNSFISSAFITTISWEIGQLNGWIS
jgi:hypothetical protein